MIDCGIYGSVAVDQILKGKHKERGTKAFKILNLILICTFSNGFFRKDPNIFANIKQLIISYSECFINVDTSKDSKV